MVVKELPAADVRLGEGSLCWGRVEELCTPAYWAAQAWMWEIEQPNHYRLGRTIEEELLACMLGGYGIPAEVGVAAYNRIRAAMLLDKSHVLSEVKLNELLEEPLKVGARLVRYRFAKQKSKYIAEAMGKLLSIDVFSADRELRDALTMLPGVGLKTASWVVRNFRQSDEVSILDVHILRAGRELGIFPKNWVVDRHYRLLEEAFLDFARKLNVRASFLDSVIWMTMRQLTSAPPRRGAVAANTLEDSGVSKVSYQEQLQLV